MEPLKPTEKLISEHNIIKRALKVLQAMCNKLDTGDLIPADHFRQVTRFIIKFADKHHHLKEEDILFREMGKAGFPQQGGPVAVMLMEHDEGRSYVKNIVTAIPDYEAGSTEAAAIIQQNGRAYANLLSQHIQKEDNILYPMADERLSPDQQELMREEFIEAEERNYREEDIESILKQLEALVAIYSE